VWVVLAQKVVGLDARRASRDLARRVGEYGQPQVLAAFRQDDRLARDYGTGRCVR